MKNIGQQVKEFRTGMQWPTKKMADEVDKRHKKEKPVRRQHIEQLEKVGDRKPRYVLALAQVMHTTVDVLLSGGYVFSADLVGNHHPGALPEVGESANWLEEFFEELRKLTRVKRRIAIAILSELVESPEDEELRREFRDVFNQAPSARIDASNVPLVTGETRESESMNKRRRGDKNGEHLQIRDAKGS